MARIIEPAAEQETAWREWVASRPDAVRAVAERFDPWTLYRLKSTGQRVTLAAISEDGTVRVNVSAEYNLVIHERSVFGIAPDDLEPCDRPGPDEPRGAVLTESEVDDKIDALRVMVRPDLWEMAADGKARRKP